MTVGRRQFLELAGAAAGAAVVARPAYALDYPLRPVRIVVAVAPGGGRSPNASPGTVVDQPFSRFSTHHQPLLAALFGCEQISYLKLRFTLSRSRPNARE